jgi:Fe-Mn family superoxide dismutase
MDFELRPLPYAADALAPHISRETLRLHHGKHHRAYLTKLEDLIGGTPQAGESLEAIILDAEGPVFDNAAQVWNHDFYWSSMKPGGGGVPLGRLGVAFARDFGGFGGFRRAFLEAGGSHFGSGWAWLVHSRGRLSVVTTSNAELPLVDDGATALICADLWEHAYYVDYHNERARYLEAFVDHLIDWDFAAANWRDAELKRPLDRVVRATVAVAPQRRIQG